MYLCSEVLCDGRKKIFCSVCSSVCSKRIKRWCFIVIELIHCLCMQMLKKTQFYISHEMVWAIILECLCSALRFYGCSEFHLSNDEEKSIFCSLWSICVIHYGCFSTDLYFLGNIDKLYDYWLFFFFFFNQSSSKIHRKNKFNVRSVA